MEAVPKALAMYRKHSRRVLPAGENSNFISGLRDTAESDSLNLLVLVFSHSRW